MNEPRIIWVHADRAFTEVLNKPAAYWYGSGTDKLSSTGPWPIPLAPARCAIASAGYEPSR